MATKEKAPPTKSTTQASKPATNPKSKPIAEAIAEPVIDLTPKLPVDVNIDADGNILLLVGRDEKSGKPCKRLRVSYATLSKASPIFKENLNPLLRGDIKPNTLGLYEIRLADDNAEALDAICSVLHFCPNLNTKVMPASVLFQVAKLCKKYACQNHLKHSVAYWFERCVCVTSKEKMMLFAASLKLDDVEMSRKFLKELLLTTTTSMRTMDVSDLGLEPGVMASLEFIRLELLHEVRNFIDTKVTNQFQLKQKKCADGCNASAVEGAALIRELASQGLWPTTFEKVSLSTLLEKLKHLFFEQKPAPKPCKGREALTKCVVGSEAGFSEKLYHARAARILESLDQKVKGFQV